MFKLVCDAQLDTKADIHERISWVGGWYKYGQRPFMSGKPASTKHISFGYLVTGYLHDLQTACAHIGSQARFIMLRSGTAQHSTAQHSTADLFVSV